MIGLNEEAPANEAAAVATSPENRHPTGEPVANGTAAQTAPAEGGPAAAGGADQGDDAAERAQALADGIAHRVGYFAAWGARKLVGLASRTREALQDFWAEIQDFRHGRHAAAPTDPKPESADDATGR
jgi:hypothetical protein